jgi:molybdopterin-guanine dinucleotide biosynthesis protein A/GNAT superfamily N-acetyltransferase
VARHALTGVLLVGGASTRFGSPKALAQLGGETLAERGWRVLGEACDERIAVGKEADGLELPFPVLDDGRAERHPAAGVAAGLLAAPTEIAVFLPVDCPLVPAEVLRALGDACRQAAVPATGDPLPGAYRRDALPTLEARLAEGASLRGALDELATRLVAVDPALLANVNTPADLDALRTPIVPFRPEHADGFRSLVADTLAEFGFEADSALDPDLGDPAAVYRHVWVALDGDDVVGTIALRSLDDGALELKRMYLQRCMRGRGLGRRLLAVALASARADGATRICLDTTEGMAAARGLYERHGFRRVPGEAPRQGKQRLLYELEL